MKKAYWLLPLTLVLLCLSLSIGPSSQFSWVKLFQGDAAVQELFFQSRLPRTLAIVLAAGAMSLAGLLVQTITQNPFAAPSTIGTTEAAQLGMLLTLFVFPKASLGQKMVFAFVAAMVCTLFFLKVVRKLQFKEAWKLPLVGVIYGGMIGALAQTIAYRFNLVQSMTTWTQGSFSLIQTHQYEWLFLNLIIVGVVWFMAEGFSLMALGQETSRLLGLPFEKMEGLALFLVALTTAVTMITVGSLPFLGVIVPNLVRQMTGDHLKRSLWLVVMTGVSLVLLCDILARLVISPYEVSVSVILGIIGCAVFIRLLWKGAAYD